ncbi:MAG: glycosyltransferase family 2 protein [Paracoccaceae bacterium]
MTLSCIIPAYNEAARIAAVLEAVLDHPLIDEVIVVDDGSADDTVAVVTRFPQARLIALPRNGGKTAALIHGLAAATGDLILLVDADLVGLAPAHLTALIAPVRENRADIAISLRDNAPFPWRWIGLDYISGERVLHKSLLAAQTEALQRLPKFGFEVFLNSLCIAARTRIAVVRWPGVVSPLKSAKYGLWTGIKGDIAMMRDVFRAVPPLGLLRQIIAMRRLRV